MQQLSTVEGCILFPRAAVGAAGVISDNRHKGTFSKGVTGTETPRSHSLP